LPYKLAGKLPSRARWRSAIAFTAGEYDDAIALGRAAAAAPDVASVRRAEFKKGFGVSTQVEISQDVGAYVRAGWSDGKTEAFMFTEIDVRSRRVRSLKERMESSGGHRRDRGLHQWTFRGRIAIISPAAGWASSSATGV